jgi:hypothetical protein
MKLRHGEVDVRNLIESARDVATAQIADLVATLPTLKTDTPSKR